MIHPRTRLVAVSNRLPISLERDGDDWRVNAGTGGLVTALAPVLRNRGGLWIGWPGTPGEIDLSNLMAEASRTSGYHLLPVNLSDEDVQQFYYGFCNEIIWPLFHDLQTRCNFFSAYWQRYLSVNQRFAEVINQHSFEEDYIWVHDYHLMNVAERLRAMGGKRRVGFFLHIPFPPPDIFMKLPWRTQILRALLDYDLLGFQTLRDRRNFLHCLQALLPGARASGKGAVLTVTVGSRQIRIGAFPISIDFDAFAKEAASQQVADQAWLFHENFPKQQVILGVDRLDYTKGIPERLQAFRTTLQKYPDLQGKVSLVQVAVPSRVKVPEYQSLRSEIEQLVGEINGRFTRSGWVPIHYLFRPLERRELLAYYRLAEIALITPLKDGMNLVAKEYCACNLEGNGILILSEFAGAACQLLRGALLVNPYDIEAVADTIHRAYTMPLPERQIRMRKLRETGRRHNIFRWVDSFLRAALSKQLGDFPIQEEGSPPAISEEEPG